MLSDIECRSAVTKPNEYRLNDGGSLYLLIRPTGSKAWEFRFKRNNKVRGTILGKYPEIGVRQARVERDRVRTMLHDGLDPVTQKQLTAENQRQQLAEARAKRKQERAVETADQERQKNTFSKVFEDWFAAFKGGWTAQHAHQTYQSINDHIAPALGNKPIADITSKEVIELLQKLLNDGKVETAARVKQRCSAIFEYAVTRGLAAFDPVTVLRSEFIKLKKLALKANPKKHLPAVSMAQLPELLRAMAGYGGSPVTKSLMWLMVYTGVRTVEGRYATWDQFDFDNKIWTVPEIIKKERREHQVFLSDQAIAVLQGLKHLTGDGSFIFPNERKLSRPLSENAVLYALGALGYKGEMCGHGFRTIISTYANESGKWRSDVVEAVLAHKDKDAVRDAYNRAKYLAERERLMQWWADEIDQLKLLKRAS